MRILIRLCGKKVFRDVWTDRGLSALPYPSQVTAQSSCNNEMRMFTKDRAVNQRYNRWTRRKPPPPPPASAFWCCHPGSPATPLSPQTAHVILYYENNSAHTVAGDITMPSVLSASFPK
jgi:hypothetical protein